MKRFFTSRVLAVIIIAILLAIILAVTSSLTGGSNSGSLVQSILSPFRTSASYLTDRAEDIYNYIFEYESLLAENQKLKDQLSQLEDDARRADSLAQAWSMRSSASTPKALYSKSSGAVAICLML